MKSILPVRIDRMPSEPSARPRLTEDEAIAFSLNSVPFKWWRTHKNEPPLSETSEPVRAVKQGLRMSGWKIVPMTREDYE